MASRAVVLVLGLSTCLRHQLAFRISRRSTMNIAGSSCATRSTTLRRRSTVAPSLVCSTTAADVKRRSDRSSGPRRDRRMPPRRGGCFSPLPSCGSLRSRGGRDRRPPGGVSRQRQPEERARALRSTGPLPRSVHRQATALDDPIPDEGRQPVRAGLDPRTRRPLHRGHGRELLADERVGGQTTRAHDSRGRRRVTDITGGTMGARTAVADELQVGETRLRHVAFLVVRDDQQPFVDLAPDERGVLGLPALLAFEAFRWTADGAFEIAFPAPREIVAALTCVSTGRCPSPRRASAIVASPCISIPAPSRPTCGPPSPGISRRS